MSKYSNCILKSKHSVIFSGTALLSLVATAALLSLEVAVAAALLIHCSLQRLLFIDHESK
jgi:hypothetical protein